MMYKAFSCLTVASALGLSSAALAQDLPTLPMAASEVQSLPSEYRTAPVISDFTETITDENGVETITRTRRIEHTAPVHSGHAIHEGHETYAYRTIPAHGPAYGYAPAAGVFEREQWIDECERRTSGRDNREKGGIIGGLLGAIAGGIIGNRVADGDRLAGTLIGVGTGGIGGALLGGLIGGGRNDRGDYDCEAALDSYLSQYGHGGPATVHRVAYRTIPAPAYAPPPPAYGYGYGYAPGYQSYGYSYAPPQQVVYVPIRYEQQQRVIVRETVTEETIPGAVRNIPAPEPRPVVQPVPRPSQPRYIKGN